MESFAGGEGEKSLFAEQSKQTSLTAACPKWRGLKSPLGKRTEQWGEEFNLITKLGGGR